jgi:hypothetical protein
MNIIQSPPPTPPDGAERCVRGRDAVDLFKERVMIRRIETWFTRDYGVEHPIALGFGCSSHLGYH